MQPSSTPNQGPTPEIRTSKGNSRKTNEEEKEFFATKKEIKGGARFSLKKGCWSGFGLKRGIVGAHNC